MSSDVDLDLALDLYAAMVPNLPAYDDELEVSNVLVWRDAVHDALKSGQRLSDEQAKRLNCADNWLLHHRTFLMRRFPGVLGREAGIPKEYWWWHLHEGPQVREEALAAAKSG